MQVQFRYAFVCDAHGVKVFDVTDLAIPRPVAELELHEAPQDLRGTDLCLRRRAGRQGLVILDVENPERPRIDQVYNANGCINDLHDVKLGDHRTAASSPTWPTASTACGSFS